MKRIMASLAIGALFLTAGAAFADSSGTKPVQTPTTGHRGAPTNTCGAPGTATPGGAGAALGSPFNSSGTAGTVYAGKPGHRVTREFQFDCSGRAVRRRVLPEQQPNTLTGRRGPSG